MLNHFYPTKISPQQVDFPCRTRVEIYVRKYIVEAQYGRSRVKVKS